MAKKYIIQNKDDLESDDRTSFSISTKKNKIKKTNLGQHQILAIILTVIIIKGRWSRQPYRILASAISPFSKLPKKETKKKNKKKFFTSSLYSLLLTFVFAFFFFLWNLRILAKIQKSQYMISCFFFFFLCYVIFLIILYTFQKVVSESWWGMTMKEKRERVKRKEKKNSIKWRKEKKISRKTKRNKERMAGR